MFQFKRTKRFHNLHSNWFFRCRPPKKKNRKKKGKNDFLSCSLLFILRMSKYLNACRRCGPATRMKKKRKQSVCNNPSSSKWKRRHVVVQRPLQEKKENRNSYNLLSKQQYCRPICLLWQFGMVSWLDLITTSCIGHNAIQAQKPFKSFVYWLTWASVLFSYCLILNLQSLRLILICLDSFIVGSLLISFFLYCRLLKCKYTAGLHCMHCVKQTGIFGFKKHTHKHMERPA